MGKQKTRPISLGISPSARPWRAKTGLSSDWLFLLPPSYPLADPWDICQNGKHSSAWACQQVKRPWKMQTFSPLCRSLSVPGFWLLGQPHYQAQSQPPEETEAIVHNNPPPPPQRLCMCTLGFSVCDLLSAFPWKRETLALLTKGCSWCPTLGWEVGMSTNEVTFADVNSSALNLNP